MLKPVAGDNYGTIGETTKQDKKWCTSKVLIGVIAALLLLMVAGKVFFDGFDANGKNSMENFSKVSSESDIQMNDDVNEDSVCCRLNLACCN